MRKFMLRFFVFVLIVAVVVVDGWRALHTALNMDEPVEYNFDMGASSKALADTNQRSVPVAIDTLP